MPVMRYGKLLILKSGKKPNRLVVADLNNDGRKEVIVSNQWDGTITVFKNIESDENVKSQTFNVGKNPTEIGIADMNNDGYLDVVIANHESSSFRILLNDRTGNLLDSVAVKYEVNTSPHIHTLGIGDFNQDKINDVVIDSWGSSEVSIYYLSSKPSYFGKPTIIKVKEQPRTNLVVADIDDDDLPDIVTPSTRFGGVNIVLGRDLDSPIFIKTSSSPFYVAVADTNLDGHQDIITVHRNGNYNVQGNEGVTLLLGNGKGKFKFDQEFPKEVKGAPSSVSVGNIDGDGLPEIITANYRTNSVAVIYKESIHVEYKLKEFSVGKRPESITVADIDNDKVSEVLVANRESNDISILKFVNSSANKPFKQDK